jgi:hypothetical protein
MAWTHQLTDDYQSVTSGQTSMTLTAGTVGDLRLVYVFIGNTGNNVTAMSGGGVTTWKRVDANFTWTAPSAQFTNSCVAALWAGVVTGSGTALTVTFTGTIGSTTVRMLRCDFRSPRGVPSLTFVNDGSMSSSSGTTVGMASRTATRQHQLVVGFSWLSGSYNSGGSPGNYTFAVDGSGNGYCYNLDAGPATTEAPSFQQTPSGTFSNVMYILDDGWIPPPTNLNQAVKLGANF